MQTRNNHRHCSDWYTWRKKEQENVNQDNNSMGNEEWNSPLMSSANPKLFHTELPILKARSRRGEEQFQWKRHLQSEGISVVGIRLQKRQKERITTPIERTALSKFLYRNLREVHRVQFGVKLHR